MGSRLRWSFSVSFLHINYPCPFSFVCRFDDADAEVFFWRDVGYFGDAMYQALACEFVAFLGGKCTWLTMNG